VVGLAVGVPLLLVSIAVVDAALAGFRAATGRNGRIFKRRYYLTAMVRGLAAGAAVLGCLAVVLGVTLVTALEPAARYLAFVRAGTAMLWVVGPFAALTLTTLAGYAMLPRRPATFLMIIGLGPLTLIRPWLTVAAGLAAAAAAGDLPTAACAILAAAGVLVVEPWVHRRWYAQPA
jgi:hypothetical protein